MSVTPGRRLGHYDIVAPLGSGGMGQVFHARDTRLDRDVALKMLTEEQTRDRTSVERFIREARAASALNHPNIVTIYEVGEAEEGRYIVMEMVRGGTLRDLIGRLSMGDVVKIARQITKALEVAHAANIAHRDIKPENIMVRPDGYVKVLDFGLARLLPPVLTDTTADTTAATGPGVIVGTVRYMAPEQARGEPAGAPADVFALGLVMYEMATGYHPFLATSPIGILHAILSRPPVAPSKLNPEIPSDLEKLILEMLDKESRLRPTTADVDARLGAIGATGSVPAPVVERPVVAQSTRHTVGRDLEREELLAAFKASQSRGLLVCVTGEAGLGKTTLVEDFLSDLDAGDTPVHVARGRSSERLAGTEAYLPFIEALDTLLHGEERDSVASVMKVLAPSWFLQLVPLAAEESAARLLAETKAGSQERMKRELAAFLEEIARQRPLVLFLEDIHWADGATIDLMAYLAARADAVRVLLVATYRPSEMQLVKHPFLPVKLDLQGRGACREIAITFLTRDDVERYLALEFPEHEFPLSLSGMIHGRTEGNALFMRDLVEYLRSRKVIAKQQGVWRLTGAQEEAERDLPESVRSMIRRKIESLSEDDRRLLLAGSVQGYQFDSSVVARATEIAPTLIEERLDTLERVHAFVRFISEREFPDGTPTLRYQFVHVLYQNALYESLRATRRAALSAAVANAMVGFYRDQTGVVASELALLFEAARDAGRAAGYFLVAAQNAVKVFAHHEAAVLARHGLELMKAVSDRTDRAKQELQLLLTLGTAVTAVAGFSAPELLQTYTRARELCQELGDNPHLGHVLHGLYRYHLVHGELPIAYEAAGQLVAFAEQSQDPQLVRIASGAAGVPLLHMGEFAASREQFERCIDRYDPEPLRAYTMRHGADPGMAAMLWLSMVLWLQGYPEQASARNRQALELARRVNYPFGLAYALSLTAWFHHMRREPGLAEHHAEAALALSREHGFVQWLAVARMFHSWARSQRGLEDGLTELVDSVASFKNTSAELDLPHFLALLADAHCAVGSPEDGLVSLDQALVAAHKNRDRYWEPELYRLEGELRSRLGAGAGEVEECFRQAVDVARQQGARSLELRALTRLSHLMRGTAEHNAVRADLAAAYGAITGGSDTPDLRDAKAELGEN